MIYLARSKHRRDYIAKQVRSSMEERPDEAALSETDSAETAVPATIWQRFTWQLPAWLLILGFAAVPVGALVYILNR